MIFVVGIVAAASLGLGWVLQQRAAAQARLSELVSLRLLVHLARRKDWLLGIAAMVCGQLLGAVSLGLGPVALVEPLLSTNLLFAFVLAAALARRRASRREIGGAVLLSAALGVFIGVGDPHTVGRTVPSAPLAVLAISVLAGTVVLLVAVGKRRGLVVEAVLLATGAGLLYGLQDGATQAALDEAHKRGVAALLGSPWPYVIVVAAITGILLSQSAFRASGLDHSLAPTAAAEPITGVALGITVFGNSLTSTVGALTLEALCVLAMIAGTVEIGRSATLKHDR